MDLTIIILTYNEEIHLERCIKSFEPIASQIFIVDSFSTDRTVEIAKQLNIPIKQRKFINQANQFNWALDNIPITTEWVMRMDADEYLEMELTKEIIHKFNNIPPNIDGIYIKRKVFFFGKWIRYGGVYPQILLRIWRNGKGRAEQRWMDEHIVLSPSSKTIVLDNHMVDDNKKGITFWVNKHNSYASREMITLLNLKYSIFDKDNTLKETNDPQAKQKRILKEGVYSKIPVGLRSLLYFLYRYFLLLGFLDGSKGFIYHYLQGFWYRFLVDVKIVETENLIQGDPTKLKRVILEKHGINLD